MSNEQKRISIALVTHFDVQDKRTWSGVFSYMTQALQKHCGEVTSLGPMAAPKEELIGRALHRGAQIFLGKGFAHNHGFLVAKRYAKIAAQRLAERPFDIIFAPAAATEIAFLETDLPIVLAEDSTYGLLLDYYPWYSNLVKRSRYELQTVETLALRKASAVLSSSTWVARSAVEDYHIDPQKVHAIPFGANISNPPSRADALAKKKTDRCRLLFVGVDWLRKGGSIAFETLLNLETSGIPTELIICGCTPPKGISHEHMTVIPFLDKNDVRQARQLEDLYRSADFMLLPTRSDCTPIVFCEANAFGLPVISTQTGGVSSVINDGENGFSLPLDAGGAEYAELIGRLYRDEQRYAELVATSRAAFESRLNWDAWATAVQPIIAGILDRKRSRTDARAQPMPAPQSL